MKKINFTLTFLTLFLLLNCSKTQDNNIVEIRERMFIGQVNNIYLNTDDYLGKTIKLEGMFFTDEDYDGSFYHIVYRYGPGGCCGIDGIVGFEVKWALDKAQKYPEQDSWVEAVGELKIDNQYLFIELASLTEMEVRGKEYVMQ